MSSAFSTAPWQFAPVSSLGRVVSAALAALAIDSIWLWPVSPNALLALTLVLGPAVVAVRVIRGFDGSLVAALMTFALMGSMAIARLRFGPATTGNTRSALMVAAALAVCGLVAAVAALLEQRRKDKPAVIELTRSTTRDPFARARR
ncbi:MAG TPA: hypothetical protein VM076_04490 [Gemmatimonadaceae bacterium]|nr:hypothetical protein [Gemmatimonadaceae bacterium]